MTRFSKIALFALLASPLYGQIPATAGWYQVPSSNIRTLCPSYSDIQANEGCPAVMADWSGGLFDTKRNRLIITGGGHMGYFGNEVYALDLGTLAISLVKDATHGANLTGPAACSEGNADGTMNSRHNYDGMDYLPTQDTYMVYSGSRANCGFFENHVWTFNPANLTWSHDYSGSPTGPDFSHGGQPNSAYDPVTDTVFVLNTGDATFWQYSPVTKQFTNLANLSPDCGNGTQNITAAIDPVRRFYVCIGGGAFTKVSLTSPYTSTNLTGTGCSAIVTPTGGSPGFEYDPIAKNFVGWAGGNTVYLYSLDSDSCSTVTYSSGPSATPQGNGTYGRWRYSPTSDVFVIANDIDQNIFTLRLRSASFQLVSPNTGTFPFTVGLGFVKGAIPTGAQLNLTNQQVIVKSTWNDGSAKTAIASGRIALTANVSQTVTATTGTFSGTNKTCTDIQTANPSASVQLGSIGTVTLSNLFGSPYRTWISGPEMVECHYRANVGTDATLQVWFHVRLYADNRVWIRAVVDNGYVDIVPVSKSYVPTVIIGGTTVYNNGGSSLTQPAYTRWSAEGWQGGTDPQITVQHDTMYLESTKLVPNYMNKVPSAGALNGLTQTYTQMSNAGWTTDMGSTGFQNQIGLLPLWDALYITSNADSRAWKSIQANAKSIGTYAIVRSSSTTFITPRATDFQTWTVDGNNGGGETAVGAGSFNWDVAHHGSCCYLAYIVTGDYLYLQNTADQAALCYLMDSSTNGSGVNRNIQGVVQDRGQAWCIRTLSQYSAVTSSSDSVASDYRTWLSNSANSLNTLANDSNITPLGYLLSYEVQNDNWSYTACLSPNGCNAPWEEDFFSQALGMGSDIEPLSNLTNFKNVRDHSYIAVVGRLGANGANNYCYNYSAQHHFQVSANMNPPNTASPGNWFTTWGAVWNANVSNGILPGGVPNTNCGNTLQGTSGSDPAAASTGYWGNVMPAIAYADAHSATGAGGSWSRLVGASNWSTALGSGFGDTPMWGVVPLIYTVSGVSTPATSPVAPAAPMFVKVTVSRLQKEEPDEATAFCSRFAARCYVQ